MKTALTANTAFWLLIALFVLGIRGAAHAQFIIPAGHFRAKLILHPETRRGKRPDADAPGPPRRHGV